PPAQQPGRGDGVPAQDPAAGDLSRPGGGGAEAVGSGRAGAGAGGCGMSADSIATGVAAHREAMVALRRDLHRHPELAYRERRTGDLVAQALSAWGYEVHRGLGGTGVVGTLALGDGPRRIGIRADMDALPIVE